jgi:hypothetical protein
MLFSSRHKVGLGDRHFWADFSIYGPVDKLSYSFIFGWE